MLKNYLYKYYSDCSNIDKIFVNDCRENNCRVVDVPNDNIILDGDEIENCLSKHLDNSADRIILCLSVDGVDIHICELSKGKRHPEVIKRKMEHTSNHIVNVINESKFGINSLKYSYIGQYEDLYKGLMKKKSPVIKIPHLNKYNIIIKRFNCGISFDKLIN